MDNSLALNVVIFGVLMLTSGFFSGIEIALSSLSAVQIHQIAEKGGLRGKLMNLWESHPGRILTGILIGNNLANTGAASLASYITLRMAKEIAIDEATALALSTAIVTFLILICGEITPKTYAKQNPVGTVNAMAFLLYWHMRVIAIPAYLLTKIATVIIYILGGQTGGSISKINEQDIRDMIRMGERQGVIRSEDRQIMHSVFEFSSMPVYKIMTPRVEIAAIAFDSTIGELFRLMDDTKFSRIPIYEDTIDNIIGFTYVKNVMRFMHHSYKEHSVMECQLMPIHVPTTKKAGELLREFQDKKAQMAIVFDEFGQTAGLITMEDIIEEMVGEIWDEHEQGEVHITHAGQNEFIVEGDTEINDLNQRFDLQVPNADFNTVAGWVNWLFGHIPQQNEEIEYEQKLIVKVLEVRKMRVVKVQIRFKPGDLKKANPTVLI